MVFTNKSGGKKDFLKYVQKFLYVIRTDSRDPSIIYMYVLLPLQIINSRTASNTLVLLHERKINFKCM